MTPEELTQTFRRFASSYRRALLAKAGILAAVGVGVPAILAWRMTALRVPVVWRVGAPAMLALSSLLALAWWLRKRWVSVRASAAYLDQTFGLQQRLITAEEFAHRNPPAPLYPLLVEDAARYLSTAPVPLPRPLDRTAGALILLLVLLLIWPLGGHSPLQQLAQLPKALPPSTPPPPPPNPPPPPEAPERQQASSSSSQQGAQDASGDSEQRGASGADQPSSGSESGGPQGSASGQSPSGQQEHSSTGGKASPEHAPHAAARDRGEQGREGASKPEGGAGERAGDASGRTGSKSQGGRASQGQSSGNQEALKADIQQLLKEVSGELQQLQAQLANAEGQTNPNAGTSTDPELYERSAPLDQGHGDELSIHLPTDTAPTQARRPGGGVGKPSGEAAPASPQAKPEAAELSDTPAEEPGGARQVVPPEYRNVFDRLQQQQRTQPSRTP